MFSNIFISLLLLPLRLHPTQARRPQRQQRPHITNHASHLSYPPCSIGLFPLPAHLDCGTIDATMSSSFSINFVRDTPSTTIQALQDAINRTLHHVWHLPHVVSRGTQAEPGIEPQLHSNNNLVLNKLVISITSTLLTDKILDTDESYALTLDVDTDESTITASLTAPNVYGALYGLSTFVQLLRPPLSSLSSLSSSSPVIRGLPISIQDAPRFPWRGILLDTANHYFPLDDIYRTLGAMFINRYNVLHLHLVDSYSFPFNSTLRPKLVQGAWTPSDVYAPDDLQQLQKTAMSKYGIRILLEIDMPGHAYSWGIGYPNIVAKCPGYGDDIDIGHINAVPLDPSIELTYDIVEDVVRELLSLMGSQPEFIHLGGDEINIECWNYTNSSTNGTISTSAVRQWKEKNNYTWSKVVQLFYRTVWNRTMGSKNPPNGVQKVVTWEDLYLNRTTGSFDFHSNNVPFTPKEAIIEVWTNTKYLSEVVKAGYDGLYAAGWYLDRQVPVDGVMAWEWLDTMWAMYDIDPEVDVVSTSAMGRVLGGEASMWSEQVDALTLDGRMWPRACTVAERLWSDKKTVDHEYAALRLREHRCRMVQLWGIGAGPFWSDRCVAGTESSR